jgi:hypothetical protein
MLTVTGTGTAARIRGLAIPAAPTTNQTIGTIVPTGQGVLPKQNQQDRCADVVYDSLLNCFRFQRKGLYEITYYIQGTFQVACPLGISFGAFVTGMASTNQVIPQSVTTIQTPATTLTGAAAALIAGAGVPLVAVTTGLALLSAIGSPDSFNVEKTFCVFVDDITDFTNCSILVPTQSTPCIQIRAFDPQNNAGFATCIGSISAPVATGTTTTFTIAPGITTTVPGVAFSPAGTLTPNNAFEIVFKRMSDECHYNCDDNCKKCDNKCDHKCHKRNERK